MPYIGISITNWHRVGPSGMLLVLLMAVSNSAHGQVNSWSGTVSGTFKWETNSNWSLSIPPASGQSVFITNAISPLPGARTVMIDAITSSNFPGAMSLGNLTVSGAGSGSQLSQSSVFLNNAGSLTPLQIQNSLTILTNGAVTITNSILTVADISIDGTLSLNTGTIANTNGETIVGLTAAGQMTVADGTWLTGSVAVGNNGTLTIAGGTTTLSGALTLDGGSRNLMGTLWMTGGHLVSTNNFAYINIGVFGDGQMTVSNGAALIAGAALGILHAGSRGALTLAGGTNTFLAPLLLGLAQNATGEVWVTGGQVVIGNGTNFIGEGNATGQMTVSNGTVQAGDVRVASGNSSRGALTIAGGTTTLSGALMVGGALSSAAFVWVTGGLLVVTNNTITVGLSQFTNTSQLTVSNGTLRTGNMVIAVEGTFTSAGGTAIVSSNLTIGDCSDGANGLVTIMGGNVCVTNASHNAVLDIRSGSLQLISGTLTVDALAITSACGEIVHAGGTLVVGTLILDPNLDADADGLPNGWEQAHGLDPLSAFGNDGPDGDPDGDGYSNLQEYLAGSDPQNPLSTPVNISAPPFQITSIARSGNNVVLTWNTAGGLTNQVQVTGGGSGGGTYSANGFTNLGSQLIIPGTGITTTNYTDLGGATNKPARYYRIRLVP